MNQQPTDSLLGGYRVLELGDEKSLMCGKILGDLGADVIKIERPGGDVTRNIGPFYKDIPDPEKSLYWFAYNTNKRGITLDIGTTDGAQIFKRLVKSANIVIDALPVGYMDSVGLGYRALSRINPGVVMTSISTFGQTGPYSKYKSSEFIGWSMSGYLYISGDPDRAPTWVTFPHAALHAGSEGAVASMIALWHSIQTGEGQRADVSMQEAVLRVLMEAPYFWDMLHVDPKRAGFVLRSANVVFSIGWPCKDGYIQSHILGGGSPGFVNSAKAWVKWMAEEGVAPDWLKDFDWVYDFDASRLTQERVEQVYKPFLDFFKTKTKAELYDGGLKRGAIIAPVSTAQDLLQNPQLQARDFWAKVKHPELGDVITYCGAPAKLNIAPWKIRRRAPLIGEHNLEIYEQELGISRQNLCVLAQARVI